jgi:transcriptional regulator GlxA family with amidase domain
MSRHRLVAIVIKDHGAAVVRHVARRLVMPPNRGGDQRQFTEGKVVPRPACPPEYRRRFALTGR